MVISSNTDIALLTAMAASQHVAPLALSDVKLQYPRLFRKYAHLATLEQKVTADYNSDDQDAHPIDAATGLRTTIAFTDFAKPLEDNDDCPMTTDSDANKFFMFLWKMLEACESDISIGDDASRQYDVLNDALDDITTTRNNPIVAEFEHLLGWTTAAVHHGLHALLSHGDPDRNRSLLKAVGDEWKKVFEKMETGVVGEKVHEFAIYMCETLQMMLKEAKEEHGEHATYTFDFMAKTTLVTAAISSEVIIVVTKPSKDTKLGLGIAQEKGAKNIKITAIPPNSLFFGTNLKVGMLLITINGKIYSSFAEGLEMLKAGDGQLTIVAANPAVISAPAVSLAAASPSTMSTTDR